VNDALALDFVVVTIASAFVARWWVSPSLSESTRY